MTQYLCVLLGTAVLGPMADAFGRVKSLSACLVITFIGGLSSTFAFSDITAFVLCRGIAGFATGERVNICNINMAAKLLMRWLESTFVAKQSSHKRSIQL